MKVRTIVRAVAASCAIARFHETDGRPIAKASFRLGFDRQHRLTKCSLLERDGGTLEEPALSCDAFGCFTLRIEPNGTVPVSPALAVASVTD